MIPRSTRRTVAPCTITFWALTLACAWIGPACSSNDKDKEPDSGGTTDAAAPGNDSVVPAVDGAGGDATTADGTAAGLHWQRTCGDPVCRPAPPADGGAAAGSCTAAQQEGEPCSERDASCTLVDACGARLVCSDKPFDLTRCPISRRRYKRDIAYLDDADRQRLLDALLELRLARYHYRQRPTHATTPPRLGFIIDDAPPAMTVQPDGETVDLYGFTSLVAGAVQAQAKQIETLRRELRRLAADNARLRQALGKPTRHR